MHVQCEGPQAPPMVRLHLFPRLWYSCQRDTHPVINFTVALTYCMLQKLHIWQVADTSGLLF